MITKKIILLQLGVVALLLMTFSCDNELHITMPKGPAGGQGLSAYEVWVQAVVDGDIEWDANQTDIVDYFIYIKGEKGDKGEDGQSAYELWKEMVLTGTLEDPNDPTATWPTDKISEKDFWEYLSGADGKNGSTPQIGENGNWWIDGQDTGVAAKGKDGQDGQDGQDGEDGQDGQDGQDGTNGQNGESPVIGVDGNWWIGDINTGIPSNGKSAYELWRDEVCLNGLLNPHADDGSLWPCNKTDLEDFWDYLRGRDGDNGLDGSDGQNGDPGIIDGTPIEYGLPNVITRYYQNGEENGVEYREYTNASDGTVTCTVYDDQGNIAAGAFVQINIEGVVRNYTADTDGNIKIPRSDLPSNGSYVQSCWVDFITKDGSNLEESPNNTLIPRKILAKATIKSSVINGTNQYFYVKTTRSTDGGNTWEDIPSYLKYNTVYFRLFEVNISTPSQVDMTYNGTYLASLSAESLIEMNTVSVARPVKAADYVKVSNPWDGNDHCLAVCMYKFYGDTLITDNIAKRTPMQSVPLLENLKCTKASYSSAYNLQRIDDVTGSFKTNTIDRSLLFENNLTLNNTAYNVPAHLPVLSTEAASAEFSLLSLYYYIKFIDNSVTSGYTRYVDINNDVVTGTGTGFEFDLLYHGETLKIQNSNHFYCTYTYTAKYVNDETWTLTSSQITDANYSTITITVP